MRIPALNSIGWALDLFANHALITRTVFTAWGNLIDAGYFWHYNELWIGGAAGLLWLVSRHLGWV